MANLGANYFGHKWIKTTRTLLLNRSFSNYTIFIFFFNFVEWVELISFTHSKAVNWKSLNLPQEKRRRQTGKLQAVIRWDAPPPPRNQVAVEAEISGAAAGSTTGGTCSSVSVGVGRVFIFGAAAGAGEDGRCNYKNGDHRCPQYQNRRTGAESAADAAAQVSPFPHHLKRPFFFFSLWDYRSELPSRINDGWSKDLNI